MIVQTSWSPNDGCVGLICVHVCLWVLTCVCFVYYSSVCTCGWRDMRYGLALRLFYGLQLSVLLFCPYKSMLLRLQGSPSHFRRNLLTLSSAGRRSSRFTGPSTFQPSVGFLPIKFQSWCRWFIKDLQRPDLAP